MTQSRSVAGFRSFIIERRQDNYLPDHIRGAARWLEVNNEEGYWVFNPLDAEYLAVEYDEGNDQWYFVRQDSRMNRWVAIDTVPSTFNLGRRTRPTSVRAAEVDEEEGTNLSIPANTSDAPFRSTMSTQTLQAQLLRLLPRPRWRVTWHLQTSHQLRSFSSNRRSPQAVDRQVEETLAIRCQEMDPSHHRHLQEEAGQVVEEGATEEGMGSLRETHPQNLTEIVQRPIPL